VAPNGWEVVDQAYARAQQYSGAAIAVLLKLMADPATPASSRIRAALGTFGLAREALDWISRRAWRRWKKRQQAGTTDDEDH
jgi:hypothetical protein